MTTQNEPQPEPRAAGSLTLSTRKSSSPQAPRHDDGARSLAEINATGNIYPDNPKRPRLRSPCRRKYPDHNEHGTMTALVEFLEVDTYPTITFKSTRIEQTGHDRYTMTGDLTIKATPCR